MRVDDLLDAARHQTGLDDFGVDTFREGLERLVRSLEEDARLNDLGASVVPMLMTRMLVNRLQIEDWYRRHPDIEDEEITAPLIGLGLPRTGSTALSHLLAEDPNARSLRVWESGSPCPPPSTVPPPDPRIAAAESEGSLKAQMSPRLAALVPSTPTGPMECQDLMALDFKAHYFSAFAEVRSYTEWLVDADLDATYAYERRALKLLQWGQPTRPWRLKCPSHLLWLDHLDTAFPDARFVMTHRDPTEVMVSVADVYAEVMGMFSDHLDRHYLGRLNVEQWTLGMQRVLEFRDEHGDDRFFDMDFRAVQADPVGQVRRLYEWLGEPVTDEFEAGMRRWWHENAEERELNVHPAPEEFGLDLDQVREGFAPYIERFVSGEVTR
jgi:hypothetical protein